jgi:hypothetical protein
MYATASRVFETGRSDYVFDLKHTWHIVPDPRVGWSIVNAELLLVSLLSLVLGWCEGPLPNNQILQSKAQDMATGEPGKMRA